MVQVDIASFWPCDFFQVVQSSILSVVISFLIVKTPLLCSTDVKLSSVQHHSVSLSTYNHFSHSALNRSGWAIAEPLSSQFGWGKRKADADQNMWGRVKTSQLAVSVINNYLYWVHSLHLNTYLLASKWLITTYIRINFAHLISIANHLVASRTLDH